MDTEVWSSEHQLFIAEPPLSLDLPNRLVEISWNSSNIRLALLGLCPFHNDDDLSILL